MLGCTGRANCPLVVACGNGSSMHYHHILPYLLVGSHPASTEDIDELPFLGARQNDLDAVFVYR